MKLLNWKKLKITQLFNMAESRSEKIKGIIDSTTLMFQITDRNLEWGGYAQAVNSMEQLTESLCKLKRSDFIDYLSLDQRLIMLTLFENLKSKFDKIKTLRTPLILNELVYHYVVYILTHNSDQLKPDELLYLQEIRTKYE